MVKVELKSRFGNAKTENNEENAYYFIVITDEYNVIFSFKTYYGYS